MALSFRHRPRHLTQIDSEIARGGRTLRLLLRPHRRLRGMLPMHRSPLLPDNTLRPGILERCHILLAIEARRQGSAAPL